MLKAWFATNLFSQYCSTSTLCLSGERGHPYYRTEPSIPSIAFLGRLLKLLDFPLLAPFGIDGEVDVVRLALLKVSFVLRACFMMQGRFIPAPSWKSRKISRREVR